MSFMSARTIEAKYERGLLRPVEPIQDVDNQIYLVTIINLEESRTEIRPQANQGLRGRYRGYLSSTDEFLRAKQSEKALEL